MEKMREAAGILYNPHVQLWKEAGKAVIGYPCTFVPEEIIHAAGMLPYRLRGIGITSLSIGDTYFGPVICSLPKCVLQLAGEQAYRFLDGVIITNGCDSMRRLDECWRKAGEDIAGILPGYFRYSGVPHKTADYSHEWFEEETRELVRSLEGHFDVKVTEEALKESIRLYNESRRLLQKLDAFRSGTEVRISGEDSLAVVLAGSAMPREEYTDLLKRLLKGLEKAPRLEEGRKRLMLVGSANDDPGFVRLIEESGALVVADTLCFGSRSYEDLTGEAGDPVAALSRRYLSQCRCPRMFGCYQDRLTLILDKVEKARVDGVILQNIRFCDLHGSENGIFERDLEARGIPCMRMEREYGPLVETGRIRMRIDAFLERIA